MKKVRIIFEQLGTTNLLLLLLLYMKQITITDVLNVQEQLQEDLMSKLDGLDSTTLDHVCDIVIENLQELKNKALLIGQ